MNRRSLLAGLAAAPMLPAARDEFAVTANKTFLNAAGYYPLARHVQAAAERYLAQAASGADPGEKLLDSARSEFAILTGVKASEITLVQSTMAGENVVAGGLGLHSGKGNVVTDELHYHGGLHLYESLAKSGLEVRIIKQRDWRIDTAEFTRAIGKDTRLAAITLVSNINGFEHDARRIAEAAHRNGAYLYADVIQCAGCVPLNLRELDIDFAAASTYKWLMGLRGFGFLYVRSELQGRVLKPAQFGDRQYEDFEYHMFPGGVPGDGRWSKRAAGGGRTYETGNVSAIGAACAAESIRHIRSIGVAKIQADALELVERIRKEVPKLGYPSITPPESKAPIAAFLVKDSAATREKLRKANVDVKIKWNQMRVSPGIFNAMEDVERLLRALAS